MSTCIITAVASVRQLAGGVAGTGNIFAGKCLCNRPPVRPRGRCEIEGDTFRMWELGGTGWGSCLVAGFGINGVERAKFAVVLFTFCCSFEKS